MWNCTFICDLRYLKCWGFKLQEMNVHRGPVFVHKWRPLNTKPAIKSRGGPTFPLFTPCSLAPVNNWICQAHRSQSRLFANPEALGPRPARQGVNTLLNMVLYIICLSFASKLTKLSDRSDLQVDELTIPHLFSLPLRWVAMALLQRWLLRLFHMEASLLKS